MKFWVRRVNPARPERVCWTGPLESEGAAVAEAQVWRETGWNATTHQETVTIRSWVRADRHRDYPDARGSVI